MHPTTRPHSKHSCVVAPTLDKPVRPTPVSRVNQAMEHLSGAPVIGCVLNAAELSVAPYLKSYGKK